MGEAKRDGLRRDLTRKRGSGPIVSSVIFFVDYHVPGRETGLAELATERERLRKTGRQPGKVLSFLSLTQTMTKTRVWGPAVWGHGILLEGGPSPGPDRPLIGRHGKECWRKSHG